ncbi:DUF6402 family protein [Aquimarina sp. RZ0]|uniref:DUF6402 family protein n=1 Tax=Aquimarina sp. RZ0 TaxID=2607730 RepID=UPI0011F24164|nr:DUF6402 family protein [Aquimarina sp. RZ0]KAA1246793.1 hypothetical protein F0000_05910 [Aquimarina sp. RZ0]
MILEFENDRATIEFTPEEGITAESYTMNVYATDKTNGGEKKHVFTSREYPLVEGVNNWYIIIDYAFYNEAAKRAFFKGNDTSGQGRQAQSGSDPSVYKTLPTILEFSFFVVINGEENEVADILEVHFIRYMPRLLNILGHTNGEKLQRIWFTEGNNVDVKDVDPKIDILSWDWIMKESEQAQKEFTDLNTRVQNKLNAWTDNATKDNVRKEIRKMVVNGLVTLPTSNNSTVSFGVMGKNIVTYNNQLMPDFEKYYSISKPFGGEGVGVVTDIGFHYLTDGLDDFIASLANFNYHVLATGELFTSGNSITVHVKQLGFYIKDKWDFIDKDATEASQPLGFWKIVDPNTIEAKRTAVVRNQYYRVVNKTYRDYRDAHNMGYNYFLYSTIHTESVDIEFQL